MTTTTTPTAHAAAYRTFAATVADALTATDADLTPEANGRRRADAIRAARANLAAAVPPEPQRLHTRDAVWAARAPRAEEVPLHDNERRKIRELRDAGLRWSEIVASASELRVAALADGLEAIAAIDAAQSAELAEMLFDRLVVLGAPDAVQTVEEETRTAADTAWREVLAAASEGREVGVAAWTEVYAADREGYDATLGEGLVVDHDAVNRIAPVEVTA